MNRVPLGDVAQLDRVAASDVDCYRLPYVGLEHIEKDLGHLVPGHSLQPEALRATKFIFSPRHVLYGKLRPYLNKVLLPDFDGVCTTEILPILPDEKRLDRGFLFSVLLSPDFVAWASHHVSGANLPRLDPETLLEYRLPLPDLPEQQRIVRLLEKADRLRRMRRNSLELGNGSLPAIFLDYFGDPATNPRKFLVESLESVFSEEGDGVKCGPFGSALKKQEYVPEGVPVWTVDNVGRNEFHEEGSLFITQEKFEELEAYSVSNGDILVSRAGTVGRMAIVKTRHPRSMIHSNLIRLSLDPSKCLPIYFTTLMTFFAARIGRLKTGQEDAYTFMNTGRLGELRLPLPPLDLQEGFARAVQKLERLRGAHREGLRQTEHLFQTLLYQAFSTAGKETASA